MISIIEKELKDYIENEIHQRVDEQATLSVWMDRCEWKNLESTYGSLGAGFSRENYLREKIKYLRKVHEELFGEDFNPPVGWMK